MNNIGKLALLLNALLIAAMGFPETGCYFYQLPSKINMVQAQLDIKADSTMEFSVAFNAPKRNLPEKTIVCRNETFRFEAETSEIIVGEGVLSPCLQSLKSYTQGLVNPPLRIKWIPEEKILSGTIVIPLRIPKAANCVQLPVAAPAADSTQEPTISTTTALVTSSADAVRIDPRIDSNNTKDTSVLTATAGLVFLVLAIATNGI